MTKIKLLVSFFLITILISCSGGFSKGIKKDVLTGLTTSYNGFALEDIYLMDRNGTKLNSNAVSLGSVLIVEAAGVTNFTEKDGKVFPGCQIILTDKDHKEVLNLPDAFADLNDGTPLKEANVLQATLTTGDPMVVEETYHLSVRFFDKLNKENVIKSTVDIKMKE